MDEYTKNVNYNAIPNSFENARILKKNMTFAEILLWEKLRNRRFQNLKFRRQHPISRFVADFYCHEKKLVLEVDGPIHLSIESQEYDENRSFEIEKLGIRILRFKNEEAEKNMEYVLGRISDLINIP